MRIIASANRKGGVGKTTICDILTLFYATCLHKKVLAIDFDSSNCSFSKKYIEMHKLYFSDEGSEPEHHPSYNDLKENFPKWSGKSSTADIFADDTEKYPVVPYPTNINNLSVIPASTKELEAIEDIRGERLNELFRKISQWVLEQEKTKKYDIIVIDTPPVKNNTTRAVMKIATDLIIPTALESTPMEGLFGMLQVFNSENMFRPKDKKLNLIGIVANLYERYSVHNAYYEELQSYASTAKFLMNIKLHKYKDYAEYDQRRVNLKEGNFFKDLPDDNKAKCQALEFCKEVHKRLIDYGKI